jgi:hypothetical protein
MKKKRRLFHFLNKKGKAVGQKYNFSLVAEVLALVFLGISEHPMTPARWVLVAILAFFTIIAFIANE